MLGFTKSIRQLDAKAIDNDVIDRREGKGDIIEDLTSRKYV